LQRRRPDLIVGRGRLEVHERLDVTAHYSSSSLKI
jgi:hypothetical protein